MACNIQYIEKSNNSPEVKQKLSEEHAAIFERLKKSGQFRYVTNNKGKRSMYLSDASTVSNLRNVQLRVISDINESYKPISDQSIIKIGKVSSGKNIVEVNVLPLSEYYDNQTNVLKRAVYEPIVLKRGENQYEVNGEVYSSYEDAVVQSEEEGSVEFQNNPYAKAIPQGLKTITAPQTTLIHLLNKLKEKTGIPYVLINNPESNIVGEFKTIDEIPTVQINIAHATETDAIHEYLHPFVMAVKQDNPNLYNSLIQEILTNHSDVINQVRALNYYHEDMILEEALVRVLEEYAKNPDTLKPGIIQEFFLWLQDFLSWLTGVKVVNLGNDLNLKKLTHEFSYSDDLYRKLDSIRTIKNIEALFKVTDQQFQSVVKSQEFIDIAKNTLNKIQQQKILIREKPNLFSDDFKSDLNRLEYVLKEFSEASENSSVNEATMIQSIMDFLTSSSINTSRLKKKYLSKDGVFDKINEAIANNEDITPFFRELEATRNYLHLYNDFSEIERIANGVNRGNVEDYNNKDEILTFLGNVSLRLRDERNNLNEEQTTAYDYIQGIIAAVNDRPLQKKDIQLLSTMLNKIPNGKNYAKGLRELTKNNFTQKTASKAIEDIQDNINDIKREFNSAYLDLVSELLWRNTPKGAVFVQKGVSVPVTKKLLRQQLSLADGDSSTIESWLEATISSNDPITGIVGRILEDIQYNNIRDTYKERYILQGLYSKANPTNEDAQSFHRKYIGEYKVLLTNENGELIEATTETDFYLSPVDGKKYVTQTRKRYITQEREDLRSIDNTILRIKLNELGFDETIMDITSRNDLADKLGDQIADEILGLVRRYKNTNYNDSQYTFENDNYYQALLNTYKRANDRLPIDKRMKDSEIPQLRNDEGLSNKLGLRYQQFLNEVWNKPEGDTRSWFERFMSWLFKSVEAEQHIDDNGGNTKKRQYLDGNQVYDIKVALTKRITPSEINEDLLSSTLAFNQSTLTYKSFSEVEPTINALKTIINGDPDMDILARQAKENNIGDGQFNSKFNQWLKKKTNVNLNQRLTEFVNDTLFGEAELADYQFKIGNNVYSTSKLANGALGLSAFQNIAFNWIAGISNSATGNFNTLSLAVGGKYFTTKDFFEAKRVYWGNIQSTLADFSENDINKKSLITQLVMNLDAIQGNFLDLEGKSLNQTSLQKAFSSNTLFMNQNATEHEIQVTGMIALMKGTKINGKSMWDLVSVGENGLVWDDSVTQEDINSLQHKLHALSKQLHGNYNSFDKSMLQRRWIGRLALMFRKYIYTSFKARFGNKKYDYELEDLTSGYYREAGAVGWSFIKKMGSDIKNWESLVQNYRNLDENQQASVKRTAFELALIASAFLLAQAIASIELDDDDEFLKFVSKNSQLQLMRLSKDFMLYVPLSWPSEFINIAKNPTVVFPSIEKIVRLTYQVLPWNITEEYDKKTGIANKGDNKAWIYFLKATPLLRQFLNIMNPEEQLKFYTMLNKQSL